MKRFTKRTEIVGIVEVRMVDKGCPSKRLAAVIRTEEGDTLILRRIGLNSLKLDEDFLKLKGCRIKFKGKQSCQYFFTTSWHNVEGA